MPGEMPRTLASGDCRERLACWACCEDAVGGSLGETARVAADYLRHALCHVSCEGGLGPARAVHVHQLLGTLRRQLSNWIPEPDEPPWLAEEGEDVGPLDEDPALQDVELHGLSLWALKRLTLLGDCGHRGRGYYLPTPARAVTLPSGTTLVIGGLPTRVLAQQLGREVRWAGLARVLVETPTKPLAGLPEQRLDDWVHRPSSTLRDWIEEVLTRASKQANATPGMDASSFEIYAPHLRPRQGQRNRWVTLRTWRPPARSGEVTLALCRTSVLPYRYWIATLEDSRDGARFEQEYPLPREVIRRLMYGLDLLANAVESARVLSVTGGVRGEVELRLYNWPAREEYRLLQALAFDATPLEGPHLPLRFRLAASLLPDVTAVLEGLAIPIQYDQTIDPATWSADSSKPTKG